MGKLVCDAWIESGRCGGGGGGEGGVGVGGRLAIVAEVVGWALVGWG